MESFVEKALLLLLGSALTGMLVPWIKARMDKVQFAARKRLEEDLKRQSHVLDARASSIRDIADLLWSYHTLAMRVAYAGANRMPKELADAFQRYESEGWDVVARARAVIGGMRWLLPKAAHAELVTMHGKWNAEVDNKCPDPETSEGTLKNWDAYYEWLRGESAQRVDEIIGFLAEEFSLPGKDLERAA